MNTTPTTLLRAFRHPLIIGSIALLLVNDHLLKVYSPSWLTGKLSDFAGLFFFPFLLALLLRRAARSDDRALRWGLLLTGLAFGAIKTLPAANAAATWAVRLLLGPSVRFVLDPTDLMALAVLPAGWLFGQHLRVEHARARPGRLAYAMLALGSLAALATSPCPPPNSADRVFVVEDQLYVGVNQSWNANEPWVYVLSEDQKTWNHVPVPDVSAPVRAAYQNPHPSLPVTACDPADALLCYRIDEQGRILESNDAGQTWQVSWQYPPGRYDYMDRIELPSLCAYKPNTHFLDLAILPADRAASGGSTVVLAAGNQGVLLRRGGGEWQRMGVEERLQPSPIQSASLAEAFEGIGPEFIYSGVASLLAYSLISFLGRKHTYPDENGKIRRPDWALHWGFFVLPWILAYLAVRFTIPGDTVLVPTVQHFAIYALALMLGVLIFAATGERGYRRKAGLLALAAVSVVLFLPVMLFLLWAFGAITHHLTALILALVITLPVFAWLTVRIWDTLEQAAPPRLAASFLGR